jgi:Ca2+/H+ antiporter
VALFVTGAVALLSWVVKPALPLSFRPIELAAMGASALAVAFVVRDGQAGRRDGCFLVGLYAVAVVGFLFAGDR